MARGLNKVMLIGNLGQDPDIKYTQGGTCVATINLATNEKRKNKDGEWVDHTEWHRVVVYGKNAENAKDYLKKGDMIHVEGKIQSRSWDDEAGVKHYVTEIIGVDVIYLNKKTDGIKPPEPTDDDLPF